MQINSIQNQAASFKGQIVRNRSFGELHRMAAEGKYPELTKSFERFEKAVVEKIEKECPKTSYYAIWPTVSTATKVEDEEFNFYRNNRLVARANFENLNKFFEEAEDIVNRDIKGEMQ